MIRKLALLAFVGALLLISTGYAHAEWNQQSEPEMIDFSFIYSGTVVNVQQYVNIREQPSVNSRIVMQAPKGADLFLRYWDENWFQVLSINGNDYGRSAEGIIGYINARFVKTR